LSKACPRSFGRIEELRKASLHVEPSQAVVITGRSGSGKSTLLALIGGLEQSQTGKILIDRRAIWREGRSGAKELLRARA
jgi:ABC-type lipoprotein export system ATPase subunit